MQATLTRLHPTNILPFRGAAEQESKGAGEQGSKGDGEMGRRGSATPPFDFAQGKLTDRGDGETGSIPLVQRFPGLEVPWSPDSREQRVDYTIVHSTRGRVRLRVPRIAKDADYALVLETLLGLVPQVTSVRLNVAAMSVTITYRDEVDFQLSDLAAIIQKAALPPPPVLPSPPSPLPGGERGESLPCPPAQALPVSPSALAAVLAGLSWLGFPIPALMVGGAIAAASAPVAKKALSSIWQEHRLNIDCLDLMALSATAASGNPLAPALLLVLHELGDAIRDRTERATGRETLDLLSGLPSEVWVERDDGVQERVSTEMLQPGDTVIIHPGEQIPVDGKIIRGSALIDEQKLTGEPLPVNRAEGQDVLASTLVREGQIWVLVTSTGDATRAGQTIKLVQEAPVFDTRMENYAANLADKAIVPALLLSGGVWMATGSWARVASILTLDFVTGIRVSVPTAVLASMRAAARRGILIRSGRALEKLAEVDAVVFDKTGTLTRGDVVVVGVKSYSHISEERILALAAAAEGHLKHPVAMALVRYAEGMQVPHLNAHSYEYKIGLGMLAQVESETVLVGSSRFLLNEGIKDFALCPLSLVTCPLSLANDKGQRTNDQGQMTNDQGQMWVASDGKLLGVIEYCDELRPESPAVIENLMDLDIEIHMLTGDKFLRAAAVARIAGLPLENVHASAFPEQKGLVVQQLIAEGKTVAFVGDGINDAAALAHADVAVSFGEGADVARETADVVLMNSNLGSLVEAIAIAKQTQAIISQNTKICVIPNLVALGMATTVGLNPVAATAIHNGSAIAAGVASLTPLWNN